MPKDTGAPHTGAAWALLLLVILSVAVIRAGLLEIPLDRDEGDYAHGALRMLEGAIPYQHVYQMKLPGTYLAYAAALTLFGENLIGVHLGLLVANSATILLLFLLGRRLFDPLTGLLAAASFGVLSLSYPVQGLSANTEHFVVLFAVAGLWVLLEALETGRRGLVFAAGLLFGVCILMKQHGIAFAALAIGLLVIESMETRPFPWRAAARRAAVLSAGIVLPYAATLVFFASVGAFADFWFWTVEYPQSYLAQEPGTSALSNFTARAVPILRVGWPIWALAAIGFAALWSSPQIRSRRSSLLTIVAFSAAATLPGFVFRAHYFVLVLPAAALLAAAGVAALVEALLGELDPPRRFACACLMMAAAVATSVFIQRDFLFHTTPFSASRFVFGRNPFPESLEIADRIRQDTTPHDSIAVLGSEPQIYFYANRTPATGQVYMYPLMESHPQAIELQEQMIREIEAAKPRYIVWVDPRAVPWSWLQREHSPVRIIEWFRDYRERHYERVGLIEFSRIHSRSRWGADSGGEPELEQWVEVLRRRAD